MRHLKTDDLIDVMNALPSGGCARPVAAPPRPAAPTLKTPGSSAVAPARPVPIVAAAQPTVSMKS